MRAPKKEEEEEVKWEGEEPLQEREVGGQEELYPQGCWKIPKIAGQVRRQLKIPASFPRATSLPRRMERSITPTRTAAEPSVRKETSTVTETAHLTVRGSKKRAASTSPARNEFRRSLKDRLPRQLRTFIDARTGRLSKAPPKPSRKAGPIGRTWVKVCDDITFMDDASEEYYPVVAYSGSPHRVPEADPLPRPPTPPPVAQFGSSVKNSSPTPSQRSDYDNVCREEPDLASKKTKLSDEELILSEITNKKQKIEQENEVIKKKRLSDQELIIQELTSRQMKEESIQPESAPQQPPARRSRETNRFKNRKQKRSGTPIAADRLLNGFTNGASESLDQAITVPTDSVAPEDDYIIPEKIVHPPNRPARGNKIYETIEHQKMQEIKAETASPEEDSGEASEPLFKVSEGKVEPLRPVRGVKVYESIVLKKETPEQAKPVEEIQKESESSDTKQENELNSSEKINTESPTEANTEPEKLEESLVNEPKKDEKMEIESIIPEKPKRGIKVYEDILIKTEKVNKEEAVIATEPLDKSPEKPKRGIKLYEDVIPGKTGESGMETVNKTEEKQQCETSVPSKPARGNKIYASVDITKDIQTKLDATEMETVKKVEESENIVKDTDTVNTKAENTASDSEKIFGNQEYSEETASKNASEEKENVPPYATVQKGKSSQLTDALSDASSIPPPIPAKKRTRNAAQNSDRENSQAPPKPARHLKPLSKSSDFQNLPKKQKTEGTETLNSDVPVKPNRSATGKLNTLPRRKKAPKAEPLIARVSIETGKVSEITIVPDSESYENVLLQDHKVPYRSRPLPPPPSSTQFNGSTPVLAVTSPQGIESNELNDSESIMSTTQGAESESKGNSCVSTAGEVVESGSATHASGNIDSQQDGSVGGLDKDIDSNLKNIETSFATLDSVLKSLKTYSETTPGYTKSVTTPSDSNDDKRTNEGNVCSEPSADSLTLVNVEASIKFNPNETRTEVSIDQVNKEVDESLNETVSDNDKPNLNSQKTKTDDHEINSLNESVQTIEIESTGQEKENDSMLKVSSAMTSTVENDEELIADIDEKDASSSTLNSESILAKSIVVDASEKLSLAAESITSEMSDMVPALDSTTESSSVNNIPEPESASSVVIDSSRKLSIAAENVASLAGETCSFSESTSVLNNDATAVEVTSSKSDEKDRKISIAAETVVIELMTETADSLADNCPTEIASVSKSDVNDVVSVADVSVISGQFADTVINTSNTIVKLGKEERKKVNEDDSVPPAKETNSTEQSQAKSCSDIIDSIDKESSIESSGESKDTNADDVDQPCDMKEKSDVESLSAIISDSIPLGGEAVSDTPKSAPNSLEGSVTSITDDDSVVSVVTKDDLITRSADFIAETESSNDMKPNDPVESEDLTSEINKSEVEELASALSYSSKTESSSSSNDSDTCQKETISDNGNLRKPGDAVDSVLDTIEGDSKPIELKFEDDVTAVVTTSPSETEQIVKTDADVNDEKNFQLPVDDLEGGVASISSRLEGISSFLDTLVRSFSPPAESGPVEENRADFPLQSSQCSLSDPDNLSTETLMLSSNVCPNECQTESFPNTKELTPVDVQFDCKVDSSLPNSSSASFNLVFDKIDSSVGTELQSAIDNDAESTVGVQLNADIKSRKSSVGAHSESRQLDGKIFETANDVHIKTINLDDDSCNSLGAVTSQTTSCSSLPVDAGIANIDTIDTSGAVDSSLSQPIACDQNTNIAEDNAILTSSSDAVIDNALVDQKNNEHSNRKISDDKSNSLNLTDNIDCISRDFSRSVNETDSPPHSSAKASATETVDNSITCEHNRPEEDVNPLKNSNLIEELNETSLRCTSNDISSKGNEVYQIVNSETPQQNLSGTFPSKLSNNVRESVHEPDNFIASVSSEQSFSPSNKASGTERKNQNETVSFPIEKTGVENDAISTSLVLANSNEASGSLSITSHESDDLNVLIEVPETVSTEFEKNTNIDEQKTESLVGGLSSVTNDNFTINVLDSEDVRCTIETPSSLIVLKEDNISSEVNITSQNDEKSVSVEHDKKILTDVLSQPEDANAKSDDDILSSVLSGEFITPSVTDEVSDKTDESTSKLIDVKEAIDSCSLVNSPDKNESVSDLKPLSGCNVNITTVLKSDNSDSVIQDASVKSDELFSEVKPLPSNASEKNRSLFIGDPNNMPNKTELAPSINTVAADSKLNVPDEISVGESAVPVTVTDILESLQRESPTQNDGHIGLYMDGEWVKLA